MALNNFTEILNKKGENFIHKLLNYDVIIYEKFSGSSFSFELKNEKNELKIYFYRKDNSHPLTKIDRTINKFYEEPINYILSLKESLKKLPTNHRFNFEYFPNKMPNYIKYDTLPKNKLILMNILRKDDTGKTLENINNLDIIQQYSDILGVSPCPIIFKGKLSNQQKEVLEKYIKLNKTVITDVFKTKSFTEFIIGLLNPELKNTFLHKDLTKNIEGVIFMFVDGNNKEKIYAKLIDPVIEDIINNNKSKQQNNDLITIINSEIIEFMQFEKPNFKKFKFKESDIEDKYLEFISEYFNKFILINNKKYENIKIELPSHITKPEFDLNDIMIKNEKTFNLVNTSKNYREIFKLFLLLFRKKRKNDFEFLMPAILKFQNDLVDFIFEILSVEEDDDFYTYSQFIDDDSNLIDIDDIVIQEDSPPNGTNYMKVFSFWQKIFDYDKPDIDVSKKKKVNLVISDFQPFHLGHLESCKEIYEKNHLPIILVQINNKDNSLKPLTTESSKQMFNIIISEYSEIFEAYLITKKTNLEDILENLEDFYPVNIISNEKYQKYFEKHYNYELFEDKFGIKNSLKFLEMKHKNKQLENINSNNIVSFIKENDIINYKKSVPECLHNLYQIFKDDIKKF